MKTGCGNGGSHPLCWERRILAALGFGVLFEILLVVKVFAADAQPDARLEEKFGAIKYKPRDQANEFDASEKLPLFIGDRLRTLTNSHATIWLRERNPIKLGPKSTMEIMSPPGQDSVFLNLLRGTLYFFSREKPRDVQVHTPHATGAHTGTEFVVIVEEDRTLLAVYDGEATLENDSGRVELMAGEVGTAKSGARPEKMALKAANLVEWWLFYPAVLSVDDLEFSAAEQIELTASLVAYRSGNLPAAFSAYPGYPSPMDPTTDARRIYLAGLLLAGGQVAEAEALLSQLDKNSSPAEALRWIIAAVRGKVERRPEVHTSASEWLGLSYYYQARHELSYALRSASNAVAISKGFAFGWERLAELEFSFGHTIKAEQALHKSLELAPSNAQSHALSGFLKSAQGRMDDAIGSFEEAIRLDSSLGNAWLGRGLVRIRKGDRAGGRMDLQMAAILEPNRALLRSYLGKAFGDAGEFNKAILEFDRSIGLDPEDPTPWLYSALLKREQNRINEAIADLEQSIALNTNRAVYRSRLLLDEDRAVRSSSLANIYQAAEMSEVALREAAHAVSHDYGNYSAHLFMAESFDALRDPTRFNLRNETVWFSELLLANLLSPVGGTPLSQHVSQQEYSRLFDRDRIGLSSSSEFRSDGQFHEVASQYGAVGNTGWALDLDYQHNDGVRVNNELDRTEWYTTIKQQLTSQDSLMLLMKYQDYQAGDNFQYYEPTNARPNFSFDESQSPIVLGAYHHEWQPGVHTLLLAGRLENDQQFSDLNTPQLLLIWDNNFPPSSLLFDANPVSLDVVQRTKLEIYTAEVQQIFENERHALVLGGRWQGGQFDTHSIMSNPNFSPDSFAIPAADVHSVDDFERVSGYVYETVKLPFQLRVTGGMTYEYMQYPENFRAPPIQSGEETRNRLNPKAALVWDPLPQVTLRAVYSQSLGGVSLDESYRLEPTQLAGFVQDFRTLIPESLVGSVSAPDHEIFGAALDLKFSTGTYVGLRAENLRSEVNQSVGVFDLFLLDLNAVPSSTSQQLNYEETVASVTVNQLIGKRWVLGTQYSFTRSNLELTYPDLAALSLPLDWSNNADLHRVILSLGYNGPSGFFAVARSEWYFERNSTAFVAPSIVADVPAENFGQLNLFVGYRFPRQHGVITLGVLNATGEDYRLNPVTPHAELPREPVLYLRAGFRF